MAVQTRNAFVANSTLEIFFVDQLKDIYWAEKKLIKILPKLADAARTIELRDAFSNHLEQTREHVTRLERVFGMVGEEPDAKKCPAMLCIAEECSDIIDETETGTAQRDVGLIFTGQKAEHYEIATYGGLVSLAKVLHYDRAAKILSKTLSEEKDADNVLTQIAEQHVNYESNIASPETQLK